MKRSLTVNKEHIRTLLPEEMENVHGGIVTGGTAMACHASLAYSCVFCSWSCANCSFSFCSFGCEAPSRNCLTWKACVETDTCGCVYVTTVPQTTKYTTKNNC